MTEARNTIRCPSCAHEFAVETGADLAHLKCPTCEAEIPQEALRGASELAEELAPGFRPGQRLGNYVIESLLGSGGMAVVFRGRQLSLNRHVAIKILPTQFSKNKMFVERFESEAAVLANLNHPNIVGVIDRGADGETYFIVMEYIEGETLKDRALREGCLPVEQVIGYSEQSLAGLHYAHRQGVVHRDIKPGNIMINREGVVKIADFGLAHLAKSRGGLDVTRDNQTMGTLKYMAPEQLTSAKTVDCRADLYSFGVCIYEMLTGKLPLGMFKMPSEFDSSLDARWDDIILRALKMDPDERYASAEEMAAAVHEIASTPRVTLSPGEGQAVSEISVQPAPGIAACVKCGHESPPEAAECQKCGAALSDLFDRCPKCRKDNRIDVAKCPGCGENLEAHRGKLRRSAEAIQGRAMKLAEDRKYDLSLVELRKLRKFTTREYAAVRKNAEVWADRLTARRDRYHQRTYEAGQRLVAEGRAEQGLQLWAALPDNYRDIAARRAEVAQRKREAEAALADGARFLTENDLASAVAAWEKAAAFWPGDNALRKRLADARIRLGNQNIKRSYLQESREAARRGNLADAAALCRKVLDLDPNDVSAQALLKEVESKEDRSGAAPGEVPSVLVARPHEEAPRRPMNPATLAAVIGGVGLAVMLLLIFFVFIPANRRSREESAARILGEVTALKEQGKLQDALSRADVILGEYKGTSAAPKARELATEMQKVQSDAHRRCDEIEAIAKKGDLASSKDAFKLFQAALGSPPVSLSETYRTFAQKRLEELRDGIGASEADLAAAEERKGLWPDALSHYKIAVVDYGCAREQIVARMEKARRRVEDCRSHIASAQQFSKLNRWDDAFRETVAALNLVPTDRDGLRLLAAVSGKITPPDGMVLVPPGDYIVGGTDASPRRVITLTHGFFMDRTEVTQARYAEFVRATNRPPLPGWTEDGLPPPGTEQWPVVLVTWQDATAFAAWAGKSLPTEEQWECACRGPGGQTYAWGNKWEPAMAELSFGPAPVGAMEKDRSPCGGSDMIGNVAEWTSTHLEGASGSRETADAARGAEPAIPGRSGASDRGGNVLYAVKGNSWAGIEKDRPTVIVPAESASGDPLLCLTQSPDAPEVPVRFRHNIEMQYVGAIVGETATARVLVRKWMPNWDQWAETIFSNLSVGDMIGAPKVLLVEDPGGKAKGVRPANVDFSTGCAVVRQEPEGWLEIRDPNGFIRRLQYVKGVVARQVKVGQTREPPPLLDLSLDASCAAYNRMPGRRNARYLNVGFRCTKVLWTPPQEMDGMAEKPEKSGAAERPDGAEKAGGPHGAPPAASQEGSQPRGGAAGTRPQQPPARPRSGPKL